MVEIGLRLTFSITLIAGLTFIGFGLRPPAPNWGIMINENRIGLTLNPWAVLAPITLIAILTIGMNLLTDSFASVAIGVDRAGRPCGRVGSVRSGSSRHDGRAQSPAAAASAPGTSPSSYRTAPPSNWPTAPPMSSPRSYVLTRSPSRSAGQTLGIVGESGSGKTTVAQRCSDTPAGACQDRVRLGRAQGILDLKAAKRLRQQRGRGSRSCPRTR